MKKNLLVAQSGGPTAAINATLSGVIDAAIKSGSIEEVFGACYGIQGVLEENFVNLTQKVDSAEKRDMLSRTPAAALCITPPALHPGALMTSISCLLQYSISI